MEKLTSDLNKNGLKCLNAEEDCDRIRFVLKKRDGGENDISEADNQRGGGFLSPPRRRSLFSLFSVLTDSFPFHFSAVSIEP